MCTPPLWPKRIASTSRPRAFARDVIDDLSQHPKRLSPKYFYDAAGSELFEQITRAAGILPDPHRAFDPARPRRRDIGDHPQGRGAGGIRRRRDHQGAAAAEPNARFGAYVPVDISGDFLKAQADALRQDFPGLAVYPVAADFTAPFALPEAIAGDAEGRIFPGIDARKFRAARGLRLPAQRPRHPGPGRADGDRRRSRKGRARAVRRL